MDELEISGKRYISTKRAGKDHKYHADYIGQLIRAKKVAGQKVGRSWYVDADSLAEYLGAEKAPHDTASPSARAANESRVEAAAPAPAIAVEAVGVQIDEPETISEEFVQEEVATIVVAESEAHIPIKIVQSGTPIYRTIKEEREARGGLRYIADESMSLPQIKKHTVAIRKETSAPVVVSIAERSNEEPAPILARSVVAEKVFAVPVPSRRVSGKKNNALLTLARTGVVLALGAVVFAVVAFASTHLIFTETLDGGQSASAGFSLQ